MTWEIYLEFVALLRSQSRQWEPGVNLAEECALTGNVRQDQIGMIAAMLTQAEMQRRAAEGLS